MSLNSERLGTNKQTLGSLRMTTRAYRGNRCINVVNNILHLYRSTTYMQHSSTLVCYFVSLLLCYFASLFVCLSVSLLVSFFMFMINMIGDEWWVGVVCKWQKAAADEMKA